MPTTAWIIGSIADLPANDVTFNASAQVVATGDYYLYDATNALSLLYQVQQAMTAAGVADAAVVLTKARKVKLSSSGAFSVTWDDTQLRDLLGFTGNLAAATSHVATNVSPLLWSPARTEDTPMAPLGTHGHEVFGTFVTVSSLDGTTEATQHGSRTFNRFQFKHVNTERVWTTSEANGEYRVWWENVGSRMARWKLYREVAEDTASTAAVSLGSPLGPYVVTVERKAVDWSYDRSRGFEWTDARADIDIPCHLVPEYT